MVDDQPAQQIRVNPVASRGTAGTRFGIQGGDPHDPHEPLGVFAVNDEPVVGQRVADPSATQKRVLQVNRIDAAHQVGIGIRDRLRLIVGRRPGNPQQRALSRYGQLLTGGDHGSPYLDSQRASPPSKKSRSTVNSPILAYSSAILASWSAARAADSKVALALSNS